MNAEGPNQIFVLQQLREVSQQVEAENGRRANFVVRSSTTSTYRQFVVDCRPSQTVLIRQLTRMICAISAGFVQSPGADTSLIPPPKTERAVL